MAKVYISSTVVDLEAERTAVMEWLVQAGHQPVHSYRPNSETVRESCLEDIDRCDLYVLILGHRYGFQIEENNPEKLSITHLEFRRAKESGIPRIALLRTSIPNVRLSDLQDPKRAKLVFAFDAEVRREVRPAEFSDMKGLIQGLSTGVQDELERLSSKDSVRQDDPRVLDVVATLTRVIDERENENVTLRGRVKELEEQLRSAVARTLTAAAQPGAGEAEIAAANALEAGDTRPAESLLSEQEQREAAQIGTPGADDASRRREAAALAREQGALAIGESVGAALAAFQRAAEYEPEDTWTHFFIGDLQLLLGNLEGATESFQRGATVVKGRLEAGADDVSVQNDLAVSQEKIGDVRLAQGDVAEALKNYRSSLEIREALTRDHAHPKLQSNLSVSHERLGNVLLAQGDPTGALRAYRGSLEIREALTASNPADPVLQRSLSVSHNKIGDVLLAQGDGAGALKAYGSSLDIAEALVARDPHNTLRKRDLSVSYEKIGDARADQNDASGALKAYRRTLEIAEALTARDPANTEWLTDLAVSCSKLGTLKHGQTKKARRQFLERGRKILTELKEQGRLLPSKDWIGWFDRELKKLE